MSSIKINEEFIPEVDVTNEMLTNHNLVLKQIPIKDSSKGQVGDQYGSLTDSGWATYQLSFNESGRAKTYLFLNTHTSGKSAYLISNYDDASALLIFGSNSVTFSFNKNQNVVTATATGVCRGYMFELVGLASS